MLRIIFFLILFFCLLKKQKETFVNPYNLNNNENFIDTETFFQNMNTQPIIHDNDSLYDIYDKIDNTSKFRRLKDIICYSDNYCSSSPILKTLSDL